MTLQGADQLRARLRAIGTMGADLAQDWADAQVQQVRSEIPVVSGETARSVHAEEVSNDGARVVGSPVVTYLAKGTAAHTEEPRDRQAMRFAVGGQTIFSKRVNHPATAGNPRILGRLVDSLGNLAERLYATWNRAA